MTLSTMPDYMNKKICIGNVISFARLTCRRFVRTSSYIMSIIIIRRVVSTKKAREI